MENVSSDRTSDSCKTETDEKLLVSKVSARQNTIDKASLKPRMHFSKFTQYITKHVSVPVARTEANNSSAARYRNKSGSRLVRRTYLNDNDHPLCPFQNRPEYASGL